MTPTFNLAALPATTNLEPNSLPRLPFLHGFDGLDLLGVFILVFGLLLLYGLVEERYIRRRKRWESRQDIDQITKLRTNLSGWNPPEQKKARDRAA